ncbi:MAG: YtxH domain-containing protein [Ignavibacteria bacterium]
MFEEKNNSKSFITGLITGSVLGALAALLYAPKSGREFRQDISDKKNELLDETEMMLKNAKDKASHIIADARKKAESLMNEGKEKVEELTGRTNRIISDNKEKLEEGATKVKEAVKSGVNAYSDERNKLSNEERNKPNKTSH